MSLVTVVEYNKTSVKYKVKRVVVIYYCGIEWNGMESNSKEAKRNEWKGMGHDWNNASLKSTGMSEMRTDEKVRENNVYGSHVTVSVTHPPQYALHPDAPCVAQATNTTVGTLVHCRRRVVRRRDPAQFGGVRPLSISSPETLELCRM